MMVSAFIIGLIIVIVSIILTFWIVKKIIKGMIISGFILLIFLIVLGALIYTDGIKFQENIITTDSLFLFEDNKNIYTGFSAKFSEQYSEDKKASSINTEELNIISKNYENEDLDSVKNEYYKVFIVNENTFEDLENIEIFNYNYSKKFIIDLIKSENPIERFADDYSKKTGLKKEFIIEDISKGIKDETEMKGMLFMRLFGTKIENRGALFIIEEYKEKNIMVYPETSVFKAMKLTPMFILKILEN